VCRRPTATFIGTVIYPLNAYASPSVALAPSETDVVFRVQRSTVVAIFVTVRTDVSVRVQRSERADALFPLDQLPNGRLSRSELQYTSTSSRPRAKPRADSHARAAVEDDGRVTGQCSHVPVIPTRRGAGLAAVREQRPVPIAAFADAAASTGFAVDHKCAFLGFETELEPTCSEPRHGRRRRAGPVDVARSCQEVCR